MNRWFIKGALLRWGALLLLVPAISQMPKPPRLFVYHALPGDTTWDWQSIVIDPPLTLTRDAAGQAHLGISIPVQVDGQPIGNMSLLNLVTGFGVSPVAQIGTDGILNLQMVANTAVLPSKTCIQGSCNPQICTSSSGSGSAYTASCATTLTAIATRQVLYWYPDVRNSGNETLSIDTLPAVALLAANGQPLALGALSARLYLIWFDGSNFRVMA